MIHEITNTINNRYENITPSQNDRVICIKEGKVLCRILGDEIIYPSVKEAAFTGVYLFSTGDKRYFFGEAEENDRFSFYNLREIRTAASKEEVFAGLTALHIINWYNNNKFCGSCGKAMHHSKTERAMVCDCGNTVYPVISPAVIVAVINKDRILLTKYSRRHSHWALVAGYTEIGEAAEETVRREVMEETGLKVKNIRYYKSQPWGLSSSVLFGFICEVDGSDEIKLDNDELKEGRWFSSAEIDFDDDDFSLTREMIGKFRSGDHLFSSVG